MVLNLESHRYWNFSFLKKKTNNNKLCIDVPLIVCSRKGFDTAFGLLRSVPRTGCLSIIVFATDGKDTDGEDVRCGPGQFMTRTLNICL